jgi:hypothetical protein
VDEHIPAPDEVDAGIVDGESFGSREREAHTVLQRSVSADRRREPLVGELDMTLDRVEPGNGEPEALGQLQCVVAFAASEVDGCRAARR